MCFCIVLHYTGGNDLLCQQEYTPSNIKRWTHRFSKNTSLWFREWCIKPSQILTYISVEDLGQIVFDGLHVLRLYVFIYAIYIPQTDLLDMGRKKCWNISWKMVHYAMPCHAFGDNVKPGADALKQTLKAITYVICIMQHINRYHRTSPCHSSTILRQESVLPRWHLEQMHGKCDWYPRTGNLCHWLTREVPLETKNQTHPSTCTYTK